MAAAQRQRPAAAHPPRSARRYGLRRFAHDRRGAGTIEFALAVTVFLLFVFGIIEFSRALWTQHDLEYAAEQAARYALAHPSASVATVSGYAKSQVSALEDAAMTVTVEDETLDGIAYTTVKLVHNFSPLVAFVNLGTIQLIGLSRIPKPPAT